MSLEFSYPKLKQFQVLEVVYMKLVLKKFPTEGDWHFQFLTFIMNFHPLFHPWVAISGEILPEHKVPGPAGPARYNLIVSLI